jgi:hypothetical protein
VRTRVRNKIAKIKAGDDLRSVSRTKKLAPAEAPSETPASSSQEPPVPKPKAKAKARAKAKAKAKAAPRIRKVLIAAVETPKRGRGRPVGSLGKKKRDALVEEELRRLSTVTV